MHKKFVLLTLLFINIFLIGCQSLTTISTTETITTTSTTISETTTTMDACLGTYSDYDKDQLDYQLVFQDEFNKDAGVPSILKWKYQVGGGGWGNDELQYYTDGLNAEILNQNLVITARKETMEENQYTSARMNSVRSFLYGKFEVRAKFPNVIGVWPAIWMMPQGSYYGPWPKSGEIDIMEHVGWEPDKIHFSIHTERFYFKINTQKTKTVTIPDVDTMFHNYQIEWLPDRIIFSVDDVVYFEYVPTDYLACPTSEEWPFSKPFYLILNLAIGGWGKTPLSTFTEESLVIDYVRVYQATNLF